MAEREQQTEAAGTKPAASGDPVFIAILLAIFAMVADDLVDIVDIVLPFFTKEGERPSSTTVAQAKLIALLVMVLIGSANHAIQDLRGIETRMRRAFTLLIAALIGASVAMVKLLGEIGWSNREIWTPLYLYVVLISLFIVPRFLMPGEDPWRRLVHLLGDAALAITAGLVLGCLVQIAGNIVWSFDEIGATAEKYVVAPMGTIGAAAGWAVVLAAPFHASVAAWSASHRRRWLAVMGLLAVACAAGYGALLAANHMHGDWRLAALLCAGLILPSVIAGTWFAGSEARVDCLARTAPVTLPLALLVFLIAWLAAPLVTTTTVANLGAKPVGRLAFSLAHALTVPATLAAIALGPRAVRWLTARIPGWV